MTAIGDNKLPFGSLPRLLLAWVCTEAVQTQSRELILGKSLSEFMRTLGMEPVGGGATGARTRLRNQLRRLFNAHVRLIHEHEHGEQFISSAIADRGEFGGTSASPMRRCSLTARFALAKTSSTRSSATPCRLT